jgi:uncharacterized membrane protein YozB (DUF420 family)
MPLRRAHALVLALLALTFVAFWPSYFAKLPAGKQAWHVHAAGALLWTLLVIVQSWSIHNGHRALHRSAGLASFVLFPVFLVGGVMAIQAEATTLAGGMNKPENAMLAQFGFFDPLANIGFAVLFYGGLKHRRNVQLHSRYMVATLLFLVAPVIWRLLGNSIPFFDFSTPETAYRFSYGMAAGNAGALALTYYLYRLAPNHGRPFLIAIGFIAAQQVLFETVGRMDGWARFFSQLSRADPALLLTAIGIASVAVAWLGWAAGKRGVAPGTAG